MGAGITYTKPVLYTYNNDLSKSWFVGFDVTNNETGEVVRKQFRGGINRHKKISDRLRDGNLLAEYWKANLKDGWSPFETVGNALTKMKFNEAVDWALAKCAVAKKTKLDYKGTAEFIKAAATELNLSKVLVTGIKRQHIKLMLDHVKKDRSWSNKAYNKNLGYLSGILSRLTQYEIIENNPAFGINSLPVAETNMYEPWTEEEKVLIADCLINNNPAFFTYVMVPYYSGIRPKEALALKISDLQLDKNLILIKPDLDEENSKTKTIRMVPVDSNLKELLMMHVKGYPPEVYVFGGIIGLPANFLPSAIHVKRDTATKLWKKLIIDGLKINKYMYAGKHTGANDKIIAGVSLEALRKMYGHSSRFMTEKYAQGIKKIHFNEIIEKSKKF